MIGEFYYCAENGMYCRFMDKRSGYCIATSCKRMADLLEQSEIEQQAKTNQDELYKRAIAALERYGKTAVELGIKEEDLDDVINWKIV